MRFKNALLLYPPVGHFQRGEERCQADIDAGSAINIREPLDLEILASSLELLGIEPIIRDYPSENKSWKHYLSDLDKINPDIVLISTTEATIWEDLYSIELAKKFNENTITIAKGAVFSSYNIDVLEEIDFEILDIAICGEAEFIINEIVDSLDNSKDLSGIRGIAFKKENTLIITPRRIFDADLDSLPYPKRELINKHLYFRPDTNDPQATIQVTRGCPYNCIFCLSPIISGKKVRTRSVGNIIGEINDCIDRHGIRDFFFRADTFTFNKKFVINLCREIICRDLKINWVANSRVDTFDREMADWMKKAGCWLIAFGIESGNQMILDRIRKGTENSQASEAVRICNETGIKTYGFFMVGFPWDDSKTIEDTFSLSRELDLDFIEIHIATPYTETEFFNIARQYRLLETTSAGSNYFSNPPIGTLFLTREELMKLRRTGLRKFYFRRKYIRKKLLSSKNIKETLSYIKYGFKLLRNLTRK